MGFFDSIGNFLADSSTNTVTNQYLPQRNFDVKGSLGGKLSTGQSAGGRLNANVSLPTGLQNNPFLSAQLNPLNEGISRARSGIQSGQERRGVSGSSFGNQELSGFDFQAERARAEARDRAIGQQQQLGLQELGLGQQGVQTQLGSILNQGQVNEQQNNFSGGRLLSGAADVLGGLLGPGGAGGAGGILRSVLGGGGGGIGGLGGGAGDAGGAAGGGLGGLLGGIFSGGGLLPGGERGLLGDLGGLILGGGVNGEGNLGILGDLGGAFGGLFGGGGGQDGAGTLFSGRGRTSGGLAQGGEGSIFDSLFGGGGLGGGLIGGGIGGLTGLLQGKGAAGSITQGLGSGLGTAFGGPIGGLLGGFAGDFLGDALGFNRTPASDANAMLSGLGEGIESGQMSRGDARGALQRQFARSGGDINAVTQNAAGMQDVDPQVLQTIIDNKVGGFKGKPKAQIAREQAGGQKPSDIAKAKGLGAPKGNFGGAPQNVFRLMDKKNISYQQAYKQHNSGQRA